jgi:uncharacterized protein (DUF427 family)
MTGYPRSVATVNQIEPAPRRVRAMLGGRLVLDTTRALYLWEWPDYPQYYIPVEDVVAGVLVDENHEQKLSRGVARRLGLKVGGIERPAAARVYTSTSLEQITGHVRFEWDALEAWFEEDEEIFVRPPAVDFTALEPSDTTSACPYKGRTTGYWSVRTPSGSHADLAWSYSFPTAGLGAIAGLIAFYNEKVDITLDGQLLERPSTHFS